MSATNLPKGGSPLNHPLRPFDIIVVGELNADLILGGDVTPVFGQAEKLIDEATLTIGSSSAIFACGAARLGLRVAFIGKVGDDQFGRFMVDSLAARGIDTRGVVVDPAVTIGLSVILSRGNDRDILTYSGSIAALRYDEIDLTLLRQPATCTWAAIFCSTSCGPISPACLRPPAPP